MTPFSLKLTPVNFGGEIFKSLLNSPYTDPENYQIHRKSIIYDTFSHNSPLFPL